MNNLFIGSKVKVTDYYGGKKGTVKEIIGSFVVVQVGKYTESFHESDLEEIK